MPWCEHCAKFWNPSSMTAEGTCPSCGRTLARPTPAAPSADADVDDGVPAATPATLSGAGLREMAGESGKAPWHFKLMVVALALYLGWRAVQLVLLVVR